MKKKKIHRLLGAPGVLVPLGSCPLAHMVNPAMHVARDPTPATLFLSPSCSFSFHLSLSYAHTVLHTHAHMHACTTHTHSTTHTHARMHNTHTHTYSTTLTGMPNNRES